MSVDEEKEWIEQTIEEEAENRSALKTYVVLYYIDEGVLKRAYKGMSAKYDNPADKMWRLSNFVDDLMIAFSEYPILYIMICSQPFPMEKIDKILKEYLNKEGGVTIEEYQPSNYHV